MRRASKTDANQTPIVTALRAMGASVQSLAAVGNGCPDLLVGLRRRNYIVELKDGTLSPSRQKLRPLQETWHRNWRGQAVVCPSLEDVLVAVGLRVGEVFEGCPHDVTGTGDVCGRCR